MFPKRGLEGYSREDWDKINNENGNKKMVPHYKEGGKPESVLDVEQIRKKIDFEYLLELNIEAEKHRTEIVDGIATFAACKAIEIRKLTKQEKPTNQVA